jgi:alanine racemase
MMMGYTAADIARMSGAQPMGNLQIQVRVEHLLTDSRKLSFPDSTLFFAIQTKQGNGHDYIPDLYRQGVRHFMVSELPDSEKFPGSVFYLIGDVVNALQQLVIHHRKQFSIPVIGITGSNGKTIVKEWLNALLQHKFKIVRSPRSYNSQLGVPLSAWGMQEHHELAIFEAGISRPGEMALLEKVVRPTIGLITNLGDAHSEGFSGQATKLQEKLLLFQQVKCLVYCKDHVLIHNQLRASQQAFPERRLISWGRSEGANIWLKQENAIANGSRLVVVADTSSYQFDIPYKDAAAIENAMHCFALAYALGMQDDVFAYMPLLPPLAMRLEIKEGQQGCTLINDSYNADLSGMFTAIDFLHLQDAARARTVILSDISGLSDNEGAAYGQLAAYLERHQVKKIFGAGPAISRHATCFSSKMEAVFFQDTAALQEHLSHVVFSQEVILIKGARHFHFEKISSMLESKKHQTRLEVNLAGIAHNFQLYRQALPPETSMMVMVKAFSYGAGSIEIARLLQFYHAEYIAVAYVDEGAELRNAGIHLPIMVMNTEQQAFASLVEHQLEPELYSLEIIQSFNVFLKKEGIRFYPVHIKLDTGMHRLGLDHQDILRFINDFGNSSHLMVKSVFTHLGASEDAQQDEYTHHQLDDFEQLCGLLQQGLGYLFKRHAANTAAIRRHPRATYEMVRLGIGLYGIDTGNSGLPLQESVSLKTTIAQIRQVKAGESVGYGRKAILSRDSRIATIRLGYADGFPRALGNGKATVQIRGREYPTVGNVCMDMTMIDITGASEIGLDDEVLVFGNGHTIRELASAAATIPYEIMTGISQRVPRIYLSE